MHFAIVEDLKIADDSAGMDYAAFEAQAIKHSVNLLLEMASRYEA